MGYNTQYSLKVTPEIEEVRVAVQDDEDLAWAFERGEACKWYDHEHDMIAFSKRFPDVLFELSGEGEEGGDLWRKYFKNGKVQRCPAIITYDAFDESKLE